MYAAGEPVTFSRSFSSQGGARCRVQPLPHIRIRAGAGGGEVPTRYLSDAELARLSGYPHEISTEELASFFRLSTDDRLWIFQEHRGAASWLGVGLQLCTLPWLGFVPDDLTSAPMAAIRRLAEQLDVDPARLADYGGFQDRTRQRHLQAVLQRLGWRPAREWELKALDDFLLERALEHDSPTLLMQLTCDYLRTERVVRPGIALLLRRVAAARERAWTETHLRLQHLLNIERQAELDRLLQPDDELGGTPLVWLRRGATSATAAAIKQELAKLTYLRRLDADTLDLSAIPPGRRRFLAQLARRSKVQALARSDEQRRYPLLLAGVVETAVEVLDELVQLFDHALATADSRSRQQLKDRALERAKVAEQRLGLLDELLEVLLDSAVPDEQVGPLLRDGVGMERLQAARRGVEDRLPRDGGHLELLEARYAYLREFTPAVASFFRLSTDDRLWIFQEHRGAASWLGVGLQLCTLPWLGFVPDDLTSAPMAAIRRLAEQLDVDPARLADYGGFQDRTRQRHLQAVLQRLGWRPAREWELKALDDFLLERALEHDSPTLLMQLTCDYLRTERVVRPGIALLLRRVAAARERAWTETHLRLQHLLNIERQAELDRLLQPDDELGGTPLVWLRRGATSATAAAIKQELAKLTYLRRLDADTLDLSAIPPGRRRFLAQLARRSKVQALARSDEQRRYPLLLAGVVETAVEVLDELVQLFDHALATADSRSRQQLKDRALERAKVAEQRLGLLDELLEVLLDSAVPDEQVGPLLRDGVGMERLQAARRGVEDRLPRDGGHLELLEARYAYLREFTPAVLEALPLEAAPSAETLLQAVEVLRELNSTSRRRVPDNAPTDFVPPRWRGYLDSSRDQGRGGAHRHYWELAVLYGLQGALRSGDVWVPGSRRFANPASYLIPPERWPAQRDEFLQLVGMPENCDQRLADLEHELHLALSQLEPILASGDGIARLDTDGDLVVTPLSAEQLPPHAADLRDAAAARLPHVDLPALLIEIDRDTAFTDAFTHAGGHTHRSDELRRNLYAALLAQACNLGIAGMADASGISTETLTWTTHWYLREETIRAANTVLVNRHHRHPLARIWGGGTLSSSDGQRFPQRGKSLTARALSRYFVNEGTTTYTHVADQHATYGTKVIPSTVPDAHYVLDEILGNPTDLPIAEHTTDTSGQTLANFALFDLLGLRFSPRIRDLPSRRLYRLGPARDYAAYPRAGPMLTKPIQRQLIAEHWDDLLRLAASLKFGHATTSLLVAKLQSGSRQNALTRALLEYGRVVRSVYILGYLVDESRRRRTQRQLNKGESLHALRRRLFFAHQGHVRRRHHHDQTEQALCLTLLTNAVVLWNTLYLADALAQLRIEGYRVDDEAISHLSPALSDHINPYGSYRFEVEAELARPGSRPLRPPSAPTSDGSPQIDQDQP